ncbi:SMUG2 DNA glycosylase family protein [Chryseobacterium formosus]|uniref:SMUG2 DNA glycosylase family protein n=1 Tax=Chryseobacterium formosus TaxID=1537363 RepID=A0ABT3XWA2_9FLAO|nr:DUF4918 family protein [Chryseobacterium formosus]MCX8525943.1 SMUG2 DNA glycosylase family protein [Chryseobacterium formosus]
MNKTFADQVVAFNQNLKYDGNLPSDFQVLNPYLDNPETMIVMEKFYHKYYNDSNQRKFLIGINPSRHGAGITGVPFTDTKRLESICGIKMESAYTHEISSVFIYDMIANYGGAEEFILGKKNAEFISKINQEVNLFEKMTVLEHPRYIQQYKSKEKDLYIDKYILALKNK